MNKHLPLILSGHNHMYWQQFFMNYHGICLLNSVGFLEGYGRVCSLALVDKRGFRRAWSLGFLDLCLGKQVWSSGFLEGFECVWSSVLVDDLGSSEFEVRTVKSEVQSSLNLGLIQRIPHTSFEDSHYWNNWIFWDRP